MPGEKTKHRLVLLFISAVPTITKLFYRTVLLRTRYIIFAEDSHLSLQGPRQGFIPEPVGPGQGHTLELAGS